MPDDDRQWVIDAARPCPVSSIPTSWWIPQLATAVHRVLGGREGGVLTRRVKDIALLTERRLALTELKVKLQSQDQITLAGVMHIIDEMLEAGDAKRD